jgi:cytochrome c-type biogenesis protein CcsB
MNSIRKFLFSSSLTFVLLLTLGMALGIATFIEEKYDTATAKDLVYNAIWFEMIFLLLIINFIGHIIRYKMLQRKKWAGLLLHLAFIVIIIGAGITRYFGFEGTMHIREGESTNLIYSEAPYLQIAAADNNTSLIYDKPFAIKWFGSNSFHAEYDAPAKGRFSFDYANFIPNAVEKVKTDVAGGKKMVAIEALIDGSPLNIYAEEGKIRELGSFTLVLNGAGNGKSLSITETNGQLFISSPVALARTDMATKVSDTVRQDSTVAFKENEFFTLGNTMFKLSGFFPNAKTELVAGNADDKGTDVLVVKVSANGKEQFFNIFGGPDYLMQPQNFDFDGLAFQMGYGQKAIELPFSIMLRDFILDRYAGSMSPSSYASEVTLIDNRTNLKEDHRIFMNNVLDYKMYRFFQSSYDRDEKGTILSVNHDFYGTNVTYFGYFLLTLGFILSLFNKTSRFRVLGQQISEIRNMRRATSMIVILFLGFSSVSWAQNTATKPVSVEHAEKFGQLQVQTVDGRFEPVHTMSYDILHKISRKDKFEIAGKGEMNAIQIVLDMMMAPDFWKGQKIIYIREKPVRDIIGIDGKYASFFDFFDSGKQYKLQKFVEEAFRKKQSTQNSFDKEIIRVDERLNVFAMALDGSMLKIFPEQGAANHQWVSWSDKGAREPLTGIVTAINQELRVDPLNYTNIMGAYMERVSKATVTNDYSEADKVLRYISDIQRNSPSANLLASDTKVSMEILYNKLEIFIVLRNVYAVLSIILLFVAFIDNLRQTKNRIITWILNISTAILAVAFLYHTFGMALRWYLSGHAPWSNGYESLILIAWGGLLAGFSFARYSKITLAATTLLAFFVLMTASHSSYDPQLTNLQPVLKSYWLIIHVATLTISYGFLGLGFILGLMNLVIGLFKTVKNKARLDLIISELTKINEMNVIVGLVLATVGTFLGGVWANESWGRYWGWDAKETWALVIVIAYTIVLHLRFVPKMQSNYTFNVASIFGFASVIMTFVGVNYYLSKGMHSYGAGDTPVFPLWAWGIILSMLALIVVSGIHQQSLEAKPSKEKKIK